MKRPPHVMLLLTAAACSGGAGAEQPPAWAGPRVVAEVLNASQVRGLARQATRLLRERGIDVVYYGTADGTNDSTVVIVRRGDGTGPAQQVTRALGAGIVRVAHDTTLRVDITVVLGRDLILPGPPRP